MKNRLLILIILFLFAFFYKGNLSLNRVWAIEDPVHYWGLIVQGYSLIDIVYEGDSQYMYHLMSKHYKFDAICYLAIDTSLPGVTNETTKENVRWAITEWLRNKSGTDDVIFIFFATHGIGHNCLPVFDADGDEGNVTTKLLFDDDVYAELTPGQQMILLFSNTKQNEKQRIFIIYVKGYYITITG